MGFVYLAKWTAVPRTLILTFSLLGFLGLVVEKWAWLRFLEHLRKKGKGYSDVLIVGSTEIACLPGQGRFVDSVNQFSDWGALLVGSRE